MMSDSEYRKIRELVEKGVPVSRAAVTNAKRMQYIKMRKARGEDNPAVAAVIREATIAANIAPLPTLIPEHNLTTRELLDMARQAIALQLRSGNAGPAWIKLVFELCEKELPEWSHRDAQVARDEYQAILETVCRPSDGFTLLKRESGQDDTEDNQKK